MVVLLLFAVVAGAGTALSPCALPVLPALLSAGSTGGRRRPLGIILGLSLTFTVTIVGLAKVADGVGLGTSVLRDLAVVVLLGFGAVLLVPVLADRIEAPLSRMAALGPRGRGDGFRSGLAVGGALGFVYTPCAGPILAAVISVSAATGSTVAVGVAYALGSALVLLALTLGGRRLLDRLRAAGRGPGLQRAMGAIMIATAVAILIGADVSFDQFVARRIPDVSLTAALERSHTVKSRLAGLRGSARFDSQASAAGAPATGGGSSASASAGELPALGAAPEFIGNQRWFNTPGGRPLTLASLRGRVVLVDFWTYTCINCIRTLPYLEAWDARYRSAGLTIVGVHSPEFGFEHDAGNVASAITKFGVRYPVAQDNNLATWNAWGNQYWPAEYLIDARGQVRHTNFGEGDYAATEAAIRSLLAQAGSHNLTAGDAHPVGAISPSSQATPETYLGATRAQGWLPGAPIRGVHDYPGAAGNLPLNHFAYTGRWQIGDEAATALGDSTIDSSFQAKDAYLVLSPPPRGTGQVGVFLDGHPVNASQAGPDVHGSTVSVTGQRLYHLIALPGPQAHRLTLRFRRGTSGFAFTFG